MEEVATQMSFLSQFFPGSTEPIKFLEIGQTLISINCIFDRFSRRRPRHDRERERGELRHGGAELREPERGGRGRERDQ